MLHPFPDNPIRFATAKEYVRQITGMERFPGLEQCARALIAYIDTANSGTIALKENRFQIILPEEAEQNFLRVVQGLESRYVAMAVDMFFKLKLVNPDVNLEYYAQAQHTDPSNYVQYEISSDLRSKVLNAATHNASHREIYTIFKEEFSREVLTFSRKIPDIATKVKELFNVKPVQKTFVMHRPSASDMEDPTYLQHDMAFFPHRHKRLFDWEVLKQTLEALGAIVILHEQDTSSRSCYVRDPLIVTPKGCIIIPEPDDELIHSERLSLLKMLKSIGLDRVVVTNANAHGGEAAFHPRKRIMFISDTQGNAVTKSQALNKARPVHGYDIVPLSIHPKHTTEFYHLDIAMMKLGSKMLCCLDAFTEDSKKSLRRYLGTDLIPVSLKDAHNMALNGVTVGKAVVMPDCSPALERIIKKEGFSVITPEKLGLNRGDLCFGKGGPHCITLDIPSLQINREGAER